jgi:glutathione S-transferase
MKPRLYVIPASPPCATIEAALRLKGVPYDVTELPNVLHVPHQLVRFGRPTVPAMKLDGEKLVGSRLITRRIDDRWPDPPLYAREGAEEAERWAEEELQPIGRRLAAWTTTRRPSAVPSFFVDSKLPLPPPALRAMAPVVTRLGGLRNGASDEAVRADVAGLPAKLDRIDAWIDAGVIGTDEPTAADLQIGAVLGLLLGMEDVARIIEPHERAVALSRRWFPTYPGHVPAGVVPADWLPSGTSATASARR